MIFRLFCLIWCFVTISSSLVSDNETMTDDERTIFYGPPSAHFGQLVSFFRLKSVVKAKAYDCKRIHYCTKGAIKSLLFHTTPGMNDLMSFLSANHRGVLGAIANGWLRRDCEKLYPKCFMKIQVVTSSEPCKPGEACFKMNDSNQTTTEATIPGTTGATSQTTSQTTTEATTLRPLIDFTTHRVDEDERLSTTTSASTSQNH